MGTVNHVNCHINYHKKVCEVCEQQQKLLTLLVTAGEMYKH